MSGADSYSKKAQILTIEPADILTFKGRVLRRFILCVQCQSGPIDISEIAFRESGLKK